MTETLKPKDSTEAIAVFRSQVIGPLLCRDYGNHGELAKAIRELAEHAVTPPGHEVSRYFSIPTLERWYYGFKKYGLDGLKPKSRAAGFALKVNDSTRELLLQIRRERPRVSSALILRTFGGGRKARQGGAESNDTVSILRGTWPGPLHEPSGRKAAEALGRCGPEPALAYGREPWPRAARERPLRAAAHSRCSMITADTWWRYRRARLSVRRRCWRCVSRRSVARGPRTH